MQKQVNERGPRILCRIAAALLIFAGLIPAAVQFYPWRKTAGMSMAELTHGQIYELKAIIAALVCVALGYLAFRIAGDSRRDAVPFVVTILSFGAITIFLMMPPIYVPPAERSVGEPYPMQIYQNGWTTMQAFRVMSNEPKPPKILLAPTNQTTN